MLKTMPITDPPIKLSSRKSPIIDQIPKAAFSKFAIFGPLLGNLLRRIVRSVRIGISYQIIHRVFLSILASR